MLLMRELNVTSLSFQILLILLQNSNNKYHFDII